MRVLFIAHWTRTDFQVIHESATVTVSGKGEYSGTTTATFTIIPKAVTNVKAVRTTKSKNTISWNAGNAADYGVEISKWVSDGYYYRQNKIITKTVTKTALQR